MYVSETLQNPMFDIWNTGDSTTSTKISLGNRSVRLLFKDSHGQLPNIFLNIPPHESDPRIKWVSAPTCEEMATYLFYKNVQSGDHLYQVISWRRVLK